MSVFYVSNKNRAIEFYIEDNYDKKIELHSENYYDNFLVITFCILKKPLRYNKINSNFIEVDNKLDNNIQERLVSFMYQTTYYSNEFTVKGLLDGKSELKSMFLNWLDELQPDMDFNSYYSSRTNFNIITNKGSRNEKNILQLNALLTSCIQVYKNDDIVYYIDTMNYIVKRIDNKKQENIFIGYIDFSDFKKQWNSFYFDNDKTILDKIGSYLFFGEIYLKEYLRNLVDLKNNNENIIFEFDIKNIENSGIVTLNDIEIDYIYLINDRLQRVVKEQKLYTCSHILLDKLRKDIAKNILIKKHNEIIVILQLDGNTLEIINYMIETD